MPPDSNLLEALLNYFNTTAMRGFVVFWISAIAVGDIVALARAWSERSTRPQH